MSRERIGVVLPDLGGGGVQRVLVNLAGGFAARGRDVVVCTLDERPMALDLPAGVRHLPLGGRSYVGSVRSLRHVVVSERLEALVGGITRANLALLLAARRPVRTLVTKHLPVDMLSTSVVRRRVLGAVIGRAYARADAVVAVSQGTFDSLVDLGLPRERLHRIANPVLGADLDRRLAAPLDDPWLSPGAPPVIVGVGRLVPQKDFATLLSAFALLRGRVDARLLILGDGPDRDALARQVAAAGLDTHVRFAGHVPDVLPYLARAAVFASTARWEGLPTALIEALAAGTAAVSTDCRTGPREILEDGDLGELVPVGDVAAVADAIGRALSDPRRVPRDRLRRYEVEMAADAYLTVLDHA